MTEAHARISPSSLERRIKCVGSLAVEEVLPRSTSKYADEGTAAHTLMAWTLESDHKQTFAFMNRRIEIVNGQYWQGRGHNKPPLMKGQHREVHNIFVVDDDMCEAVQDYVNRILQVKDDYPDAEIFCERRVNYSDYIGVENSFGTSDTIVLVPSIQEIWIDDLKYGRGVRVYAENNAQMMGYALGVYGEFSLLGDFKVVRMRIQQPRLQHVDEWACSIEELLEFAEMAKGKVAQAIAIADDPDTQLTGVPEEFLTPGDKQCQFCAGKGACVALRKYVANAVANDFEALEDPTGEVQFVKPSDYNGERLGWLGKQLDLIEDWIKGVRDQIETELFRGRAVDGWKLVEGKKGNRKWDDEQEVEALLKKMRLKQEEMYSFKLISPTQAEKLLKPTPKRWVKVNGMISQSPGKPSVALSVDKRPEFTPQAVTDDFDDLDNDTVVAAEGGDNG